MAVIDTSRDLPESCEKCWKRECSLYGIEWMSISSMNTYRNSRDKNCPLKSLSDMKSDLDRVCHTFGLSIVEAKKMMVDIVNEYAGDKTGDENVDPCNNCPSLNAIPIPKSATNGDMIKAMFPDLIYHEGMNKERIFDRDLIVGDVFNDWWNAPYKGKMTRITSDGMQ